MEVSKRVPYEVGGVARNLRNGFSDRFSRNLNTSKESRKSTCSTDMVGPSRKIVALLEKIPALNEQYIIHHKVGEGTFSSVYLGTARNKAGSEDGDSKIAIKHLVPTCSPARIVQEVYCLKYIGGTDNVVGLKHCLRKDDNCVFVMPYLPHRKFSEYVMDMDVEEAKLYLKNLLIALRRVHSFKIIHRDVKPTNFLYDRENRRFLLVDFGLAEEVGKGKWAVDNKKSETAENPPTEATNKRKRSHLADENEGVVQPVKKRTALHPLMNAANVQDTQTTSKKPNSRVSPASTKRPTNEQPPDLSVSVDRSHSGLGASSKANTNTTTILNVPNVGAQKNSQCLSPKRQPLSTSMLNIQNNTSPKKQLCGSGYSFERNANVGKCLLSVGSKFIPRKLNIDEKTSSKRVFQSLVPNRNEVKPAGPSFVRVQNSQVHPVFQTPNSSLTPKRPAQQCRCDNKAQVCNLCLLRRKQLAPRAGTPGFRPPEVLLKYQAQTTAVDIWSAGVIFLSILSGCYPFFRSPDDITALAEIMSIFGTASIKKLATKIGKNIICSTEREPLDTRQLCERLRKRKREAAELSDRMSCLHECKTCNQFIYPEDGCLCSASVRTDENGFRLNGGNNGSFPDSAFDLLSRMLDIDPDTRITASEALKHPFLHD